MSEAKESAPRPKSMRHKRILDAAAENHSASIDDLARVVPTATPDLVERVLEEYGDPAEEGGADGHAADGSTPSDAGDVTAADSASSHAGPQPDGPSTAGADETTATAGEPMNTEDEPTDSDVETGRGATATDGADRGVDPTDLTPAERETLRAIHANPEATQRALAEELGVSAATVSQRVNGIEGFEWSERAAIVAALFDTAGEGGVSVSSESASSPTATTADPESEASDEAGTETADEAGTGTAADSVTETSERAVAEATDETDTVTTERAATETTDEASVQTPDGSGTVTTDASVAERLRGLEAQVEALAEQRTTQSVFEDPELVAKVVRACLDSEAISEDEELELIRTLVT